MKTVKASGLLVLVAVLLSACHTLPAGKSGSYSASQKHKAPLHNQPMHVRCNC